ncbi:MAG: hypothetical protein A2104_09900 [Candidatus Melainabacteria bacterium GWF2_32_7]|nr:MAG: hypothetical protein A2104_09900 [Candidatus Melainabacteria bacterium GWF2_32_7]
MLFITQKIKEIIDKKNISQNELAKRANYDHGAFGSFIRGERPFPDEAIEKIAPILEVTKEEIQGWILADKYPKETIELAIKAKKELPLQDNTHCHSERSEESQRSFDAQDDTHCHCEPPKEAWQSNNSSNKNNDIESEKRSFAQDDKRLILTTKIDSILQEKGISRTALSKQINYSQGKLNEMIIGKEPMSSLVISKIAPILNVSENQIKSWVLADKYSLTALEEAVKILNSECK